MRALLLWVHLRMQEHERQAISIFLHADVPYVICNRAGELAYRQGLIISHEKLHGHGEQDSYMKGEAYSRGLCVCLLGIAFSPDFPPAYLQCS